MIVVDTNVLVDAADADSPFHPAANAFLRQWRARPDAWFATWPIIYEFLRVTTHARVLRRPWSASRAWRFVTETLFAAPGFSVLVATDRHADVAADVFTEMPQLAGNILHDTHTAILMREHGIKQICTRDADFHRFRFLEVVDPLKA